MLKLLTEILEKIFSIVFIILLIFAMHKESWNEATTYAAILIYFEVTDFRRIFEKCKIIFGVKDEKEKTDGTKNHMYN